VNANGPAEITPFISKAAESHIAMFMSTFQWSGTSTGGVNHKADHETAFKPSGRRSGRRADGSRQGKTSTGR
jgi:hypothetical protein